MFDHVNERFEHSRGERHQRSIEPPQDPVSSVESKGAEFVDVSGGSRHLSFQKIQEKFRGDLKTFIGLPGIFRSRAGSV